MVLVVLLLQPGRTSFNSLTDGRRFCWFGDLVGLLRINGCVDNMDCFGQEALPFMVIFRDSDRAFPNDSSSCTQTSPILSVAYPLCVELLGFAQFHPCLVSAGQNRFPKGISFL